MYRVGADAGGRRFSNIFYSLAGLLLPTQQKQGHACALHDPLSSTCGRRSTGPGVDTGSRNRISLGLPGLGTTCLCRWVPALNASL